MVNKIVSPSQWALQTWWNFAISNLTETHLAMILPMLEIWLTYISSAKLNDEVKLKYISYNLSNIDEQKNT